MKKLSFEDYVRLHVHISPMLVFDLSDQLGAEKAVKEIRNIVQQEYDSYVERFEMELKNKND